jgi:hypothetical protein
MSALFDSQFANMRLDSISMSVRIESRDSNCSQSHYSDPSHPGPETPMRVLQLPLAFLL